MNCLISFLSNTVNYLIKIITQLFKKEDKYKKSLECAYLTFMQYENKKVQDVGRAQINDFLCECRILFQKKPKLNKLFIPIDRNIMEILRLSSQTNNNIINTNGQDYVEFITALKKYLKIKGV